MKLPEEKQPHSMSQYRRLKSQGADVEEPEENTQKPSEEIQELKQEIERLKK